MYSRPTLSLSQVRSAMNAMLDQAEQEPDRPLAIAIVDADAKLLSYARMDNCRALPQRMAVSKAYTSAMSRLRLQRLRRTPEERRAEHRRLRRLATGSRPGRRRGPRPRDRPGAGRHRRQRPVLPRKTRTWPGLGAQALGL